MKIQRIRGSVVLNDTSFGMGLRKFARDRIGPFSEITEFGFQDGGCLMFAEALKQWSDGAFELAAVYTRSRGSQAQHVVASILCDEPLYLDSDGMGTQEDLLAKMARFERLNDTYIAPYDREGEEVIPFDTDLVKDLSRRMGVRFGVYRPELLEPFVPILSQGFQPR